jgi:hypothetical protein
MIDLRYCIRWITSELKLLVAHIHEQGRVYPSEAAGIPVISANTNWGLGNLATVIGAGVIGTDYRLHAVCLENATKDGIYELIIYQGAGDVEVCRVRFAVVGGFFGNSYYVLTGPLVPGGARLRAAVACSDGLAGAGTVTISVAYHLVV